MYPQRVGSNSTALKRNPIATAVPYRAVCSVLCSAYQTERRAPALRRQPVVDSRHALPIFSLACNPSARTPRPRAAICEQLPAGPVLPIPSIFFARIFSMPGPARSHNHAAGHHRSRPSSCRTLTSVGIFIDLQCVYLQNRLKFLREPPVSAKRRSMRKVRYDYEVTVHVHAHMLPCGRARAQGWGTAYYSHPLQVLGSRSVGNPSTVILKINLGILSCLPSTAENFRPV